MVWWVSVWCVTAAPSGRFSSRLMVLHSFRDSLTWLTPTVHKLAWIEIHRPLHVSGIVHKILSERCDQNVMFARFEVSINIKRQRITVSLGVVSCSSTMCLIPAMQSREHHDELRSLVILAGMGVGVRQQQLVAQLGLWPLCTVAGGMGRRDVGRAKERQKMDGQRESGKHMQSQHQPKLSSFFLI